MDGLQFGFHAWLRMFWRKEAINKQFQQTNNWFQAGLSSELNSAIDWNEIKLKSNCGFDFSWIHSSICELRAGAISFIPVWIDRCSNWRQQLNLFYCGGFQLQLLIPHSQSQFELCLLISGNSTVWFPEMLKLESWNEVNWMPEEKSEDWSQNE